jgi:energy-coupling factor transporter ATP-binding protein EcfA2
MGYPLMWVKGSFLAFSDPMERAKLPPSICSQGLPGRIREPFKSLVRKFAAYSKGMQRKLTIAAGIIHQPQILFLDEPTTGIDVASARQIRQLIAELHRAGTTIFLTTHYIEEAERLCERIAFIMLAKTSGAILFGVVNAFVPIILALFLTDLSQVAWMAVLPAVVMIAIASTFLGLFIAVSVSEVFEAQTFSNFFRSLRNVHRKWIV